jgi:solute carrier family 13 (sodium-dependent dicarboxylate transporter), member 2/3/5
VTSAYGDDIIFLFLGGFFIATAMEKWNLHKRIALAIIAFVGTSTQQILLGFMVATAFLSMWVSNTAAVMMMVPMALAITARVGEGLKGTPAERDIPDFEKTLIFGVGYAGTIGGLGTLIGTPPNIILAGQVRLLFDMEISFLDWMKIGIPVVIVLLALAWAVPGAGGLPPAPPGTAGRTGPDPGRAKGTGPDLVRGDGGGLGLRAGRLLLDHPELSLGWEGAGAP